MTDEEIKKRYTRIESYGKWHRVVFAVVPQYFTVVETDEGVEHAEWFQDQLVHAISRLIMEAVHDNLDELNIH
jgi:hypothetical protein